MIPNSKIHPSSTEPDMRMVAANSQQPFVFRKLFGISHAHSDLSDYTPHSRRHTAMESSSRQANGRRKSFEGNIPDASLELHDAEDSDVVELRILNQVSATLSELKRHDESAWKEFSALTTSVFSQISHLDTHEELRGVLVEHGFTMKHGWRSHDVDINGLLQQLSNIYITMQSKHNLSNDAHTKIKNIQALTFCPNVLFANFPNVFVPEPCSRCFESAVLLADISGFSKFAGEMCLRGAKGLDVLHKVTSDFLGHFVHTVYDFDGDVIAFAGDALICIFPATEESDLSVKRSIGEACLQALRCAYELRDHKMHSLSAHFAVSCGPISVALLGGVNNEWTYLMNGACISELTTCIDNAPPQNVVCTRTVIDLALDVQPTIRAVYQKKGTYLIENVLMDHFENHDAPMEVDQRIFHNPNSAKHFEERESVLATVASANTYMSLDEGDVLAQLVEKATYFIPHPVLNAMSASSLNSIAELRHITTMFLNLDSYSLKENVDPVTLQPFFVLLQEVLKKSGGFLRQFLIDDKGCVAIAMWGVPSYTHNNDCSRGLYCAWNMLNRAAELNHRCSIGLTTGHAYCGIVGSNFRRDYACIGDKVNIAARLMAKAKGHVLVDPDVYAALDVEERKGLVKWSELRLKGVVGPVTPYTFGPDVDLSVLRTKEEDGGSNTVLRKDLIKKILFVLDQAVQGTPFLSKLAVNDLRYHNSDLKSAILVGDSPMPEAKAPSIAASIQDEIDNDKSSRDTSGEKKEEIDPSISRQTSDNMSSEEDGSAKLDDGGFKTRKGWRHAQRTPTKPPVVGNQMIILSGMSGTGKSTAAQFFKQSAVRRKLRMAFVQCRMDDEMSPYSVARKVFWEIAGRKKYESDESRKILIEDLINQVATEEGSAEAEDVYEERVCIMNEVLVDEGKKASFIAFSTKFEASRKTPRSDRSAPSSSRYSAVDDEPTAVSFSRKASGGGTPMSLLVTANPEEIASTYVSLLQILLSNHPSYIALVVEEAHYCDECSWFVFHQLQLCKMRLITLMTLQQGSSLSVESTKGKHRRTSFGSAEPEQRVAAKGRRRGSMSTKGQIFESCSSFKAIVQNKSLTTLIAMKALNFDEISEVVKTVSGDTDTLPVSVIQNILHITAGNAFWVKAIAKFIKEFGVQDFVKSTDERVASDALKTLIMIRLEKLSTEQQLVVKHASVLGQEFTVRTLAAVLPDNVVPKLSQSLAALTELGFVYCIEEAPLAIYGFHNMLTRDTIYDILPPSDASIIHFDAAMYIEEKYEDSIRQFYQILGYHYSHSHGCHAEAYKYCLKAADQAIGKGAYRNGLDLLAESSKLARNEAEVNLIHEVVVRAIRDLLKISSKISSGKQSARSRHKRIVIVDDDDVDEVDTSPAEQDLAIVMEYRKLKTELEAPRMFHHHELPSPARSHNPHQTPGSDDEAHKALLKSRSSFMSAFGEQASAMGASSMGLTWQLSYTKANTKATEGAQAGAASGAASASTAGAAATNTGGCQCTIC